MLELERVRVLNGTIYAVGAAYPSNAGSQTGPPEYAVIVSSTDGIHWTVTIPNTFGLMLSTNL